MDQVIVSDLNRTPIVQIVTWLCLVTSLLAFLAHAGIKFYVFRSLRAESGFVLASLVSRNRKIFIGHAHDNLCQVFCIAQSIAVILQAEHGFGKPLATLSDHDVQSNLKVKSHHLQKGELCGANTC